MAVAPPGFQDAWPQCRQAMAQSILEKIGGKNANKEAKNSQFSHSKFKTLRKKQNMQIANYV